MTYEAIEREKTYKTLQEIEEAIKHFSQRESAILDGYTILDLLQMAAVADCDVDLKINRLENFTREVWT